MIYIRIILNETPCTPNKANSADGKAARLISGPAEEGMRITKSQLIDKPENWGRHIVILGAGASVAAFPHGDVNGKKLPTMDVGMGSHLDGLLPKSLSGHGVRSPIDSM